MPAASLSLRYYQTEAVDKVAQALRDATVRSLLLQAPTGGGKTVIACFMIQRMVERGQRVLFVVHRREITKQAHATFTAAGIPCGFIMPGQPFEPEKPVQCCNIGTLIKRLATWPAHLRPDWIIIDEAHRAVASQYRQVAAAFPQAREIGLTATPERTDGTGLGDVYQRLIVAATVQQLVDEGWLTPCTYFLAARDLDALTMRGDDFDTGKMAEVYMQSRYYAGTVKNWLKWAKGMKTIVFNVNTAHSIKQTDELNRAGIPAVHLDAKTPTAERERILAEFAAGKWQVLNQSALVVEGFDLPAVECVILNRASASRSLIRQAIGRAVRPIYASGKEPSTRDERVRQIKTGPKPFAIIIDQGANIARHGWFHEEVAVSLDAPKPDKRKKGQKKLDVVAIKDCPQCEAIVPQHTRTCHCGHYFPASYERLVRDEFVQVTPSAPEVQVWQPKRAGWPAELQGRRFLDMTKEQLQQVAQLTGKKSGWVYSILNAQKQQSQGGGVQK